MPELAEIEVIRLSLLPLLVGQTLRVACVGPHDMRARGSGRGKTRQHQIWMSNTQLLHNGTITSLVRRGKRLAMIASDGRCLVIQLGMSGQFLPTTAAAATHQHVVWGIQKSDFGLTFRDPRRFGGLTAYRTPQDMIDAWDDELGVDGLTITTQQLSRTLVGNRIVKCALLDQTVVAGVGNIYADESLHRAGINPRTRCHELNPKHLQALASAIRFILRQAVRRGGSTLRDYRSGTGETGSAQQLHQVYGREGEPCHACHTQLSGARLGGRSAVWCPVCQPIDHPVIVGSSRSPTPIGRSRAPTNDR